MVVRVSFQYRSHSTDVVSAGSGCTSGRQQLRLAAASIGVLPLRVGRALQPRSLARCVRRPQGVPLRNNYGSKDNCEFLLAYGFVLQPNRHDYVAVTLAGGNVGRGSSLAAECHYIHCVCGVPRHC